MEEMDEKDIPLEEETQEVYVPRPAWQVWAARIGVVIVVVAFLLYCWQISVGNIG